MTDYRDAFMDEWAEQEQERLMDEWNEQQWNEWNEQIEPIGEEDIEDTGEDESSYVRRTEEDRRDAVNEVEASDTQVEEYLEEDDDDIASVSTVVIHPPIAITNGQGAYVYCRPRPFIFHIVGYESD